MEYKNEEEHLQHADNASGINEIKEDMAKHFVSGGVEDGSMNVVMHSANPNAAPRDPPANSQLAHELDEMSAARHAADGDEDFVRGVAGKGEFAFAEEEADAE